MEDKNNTSAERQFSDASTTSAHSSGTYEYNPTEIFDQVPSRQASRPEQNRHGSLGDIDLYQVDSDSEDSGSDQLLGPRDPMIGQPLKNLPLCIQAKRNVRERRIMHVSVISFWTSWRWSQITKRKKRWENLRDFLFHLIPWHQTLHKIEGRFGFGVKAYFVFLRYLIFMNLLHCVLVWIFIMGPTTFFGRGKQEDWLKFREKDSILDFFQGTGMLDRSPAFFGFYSTGSLNMPCFNTPLLYIAGIFAIFLISLIMLIRRTIVGYKRTWLLGSNYQMPVSFKIFCGWDFTIRDPEAAFLKHGYIVHDLKLFLEEQYFSLRKANRTFEQKLNLYIVRIIINIIVLSLLCGALALIHTSTNIKKTGHPTFINLILHYVAPFTITLVNVSLSQIFRNISSFEDYSSTVQVNVTIVRIIFLKLLTLGLYLFFFIQKMEAKGAEGFSEKCRENQFGREMFKLCIFNFVFPILTILFLQYPSTLLHEGYPTSLLGRLAGKKYFPIPFQVLDLVYAQTIAWVGVYYCPVLPLMGTILMTATFYSKKFYVLRCCVSEQRSFRASNTFVLIHFMLFLGLLMAVCTLGFDLDPTAEQLSTHCGPFGGYHHVYNITATCMRSLPEPAKTGLFFLTSEAFVYPFLLAEIIVYTSYISRERANRKAISRLKEMLILTSSDKRFLVMHYATLQRSGEIPIPDLPDTPAGGELHDPL